MQNLLFLELCDRGNCWLPQDPSQNIRVDLDTPGQITLRANWRSLAIFLKGKGYKERLSKVFDEVMWSDLRCFVSYFRFFHKNSSRLPHVVFHTCSVRPLDSGTPVSCSIVLMR